MSCKRTKDRGLQIKWNSHHSFIRILCFIEVKELLGCTNPHGGGVQGMSVEITSGDFSHCTITAHLVHPVGHAYKGENTCQSGQSDQYSRLLECNEFHEYITVQWKHKSHTLTLNQSVTKQPDRPPDRPEELTLVPVVDLRQSVKAVVKEAGWVWFIVIAHKAHVVIIPLLHGRK